jgi:hypothetical protein
MYYYNLNIKINNISIKYIIVIIVIFVNIFFLQILRSGVNI